MILYIIIIISLIFFIIIYIDYFHWLLACFDYFFSFIICHADSFLHITFSIAEPTPAFDYID